MPTTATRYFPYSDGPGSDSGEAEWREMAKHFVADGILTTVGTAMAVVATTGMVLQAGIGAGFIQGNYFAFDTTNNVTIAAAHATLPRIDRVIVRNDLTNDRIELDVLTGTPDASPVAPSLTQTSATWEISLATVAVAAAATTLVSGNITDARTTITPKNGLSGFLSAGTRITVTGAGTPQSPYVITADAVSVTAGTRTTVTGSGTAGSPYVVNADAVVVNAGTGATVSGSGTAGSPYAVAAKVRGQLANPFRNASMHIWQRGTSVAFGGSTYGPDGYQAHRAGGVAGGTISSQAASDTQGSQTCARVQRDSGNSNTAGTYITQSVITNIAKDWANKTATFSFRARCGANFSAASSLLTVQLFTGTGTDQNALSGYTGSATTINSTATLTTSWQTFTFTASIPAGTTELGFYLYFTPVGTAGAADHFEVKDIRLDEGSNALEHIPAQYPDDLANAQHYLRVYGGVTAETIATGYINTGIYGANALEFFRLFDTPMRAAPTASLTGNWEAASADGTHVVGTLTTVTYTPRGMNFVVYRSSGAAVSTNRSAAQLRATDTSARFIVTAEI